MRTKWYQHRSRQLHWRYTRKTCQIILICLVGSCSKETPVDFSPIVHGWEVISVAAPETGVSQNAEDTYLLEFTRTNYYAFDFDRDGCGGRFSIPRNGVISLAPLGANYFCSSVTSNAHELEGLLLSSTGYAMDGDSILTLSGAGEIKLKRSLDCDGVGCQKNIVVIYATIKRADGSAVVLTNSKLVRLSDNKIIVTYDFPSLQPGSSTGLQYNLIDDSYRKVFAGKKIDVEFQGFIENNRIVSRTFTITADCCHVSLVNGNLDILIN